MRLALLGFKLKPSVAFSSCRMCFPTPRPIPDTATQKADDEQFMRLALQQAQAAFDSDEVPIGAVLVCGSDLISMGYNRTEAKHNPLAHAELQCIMSAAESMQAWRLQDATLYCTVEPCPMCAGAILQARLQRLVYGARQPRLGADGSWVALFPQQRVKNDVQPPKGPLKQSREGPCVTEAAAAPSAAVTTAVPQAWAGQDTMPDAPVTPVGNHPFHTSITVTRGVLEEECRELMVKFFKQRRQQKKAAEKARAAATAVTLVMIQAASRMCAAAPPLNLPQGHKVVLQPDEDKLGLDAALSACLAAACVRHIDTKQFQYNAHNRTASC